MKVTLLNMTDPGIADIAAKCCISREMPTDCTEGYKSLKRATSSGHMSIWEHISVTFAVEGVSRVVLAQFSRHRLMSLAVQSQRYVDLKDFQYCVPGSIDSDPRIRDAYERSMGWASDLYEIMTDLYDINEEDARYILPNACLTNFIVTMSLRELGHVCALRRCSRAQRETRRMVDEMAELAIAELKNYNIEWLDEHPVCESGGCEVVSYAEKLFGPQCHQLGYCPEKWGSCERFPDLYGLGEEYWIGHKRTDKNKEEEE